MVIDEGSGFGVLKSPCFLVIPYTLHTMKIGVLSLQGDFAAHGRMLTELGYDWCEVRCPSELEQTAGLILPGGESTTMLKFIQEEGFVEPLQAYARAGKSMFGTCAGAILMAHAVSGPAQESLDVLDIGIQRNGYGRQINSFTTLVDCPKLGEESLELVFIRAPIITQVGNGVEVLLEHNGHPIWVRKGTIMAATFHPELTQDTRIHKLFAEQALQ